MEEIYDLGSKTQIKRKFKEYLESIDQKNLKQNKFSLNLSNTLVILLDSIVQECLSYVEKDSITGIYLVKIDYIKYVLTNHSKYDFINKYLKMYNSNIRYQDNLFFNIDKVYNSIDTKYGKKMMLENSVKNFLNYILVSIQNDISQLSCSFLNFSGKKTFSKDLLIEVFKYIVKDDHILKRIILKLDSDTEDKSDEKDEEETENN